MTISTNFLFVFLFFLFLIPNSLQLLDIRDTTPNTFKNMSEQSESNNKNEIGNERTEITVELIEEKDIPEVLELLKEFFFKVRKMIAMVVGRYRVITMCLPDMTSCDTICQWVFIVYPLDVDPTPIHRRFNEKSKIDRCQCYVKVCMHFH